MNGMTFSAETHEGVKSLTAYVDDTIAAITKARDAAIAVHEEANAAITKENLEVLEEALREFTKMAETVKENIEATSAEYQKLGEDLHEYK